MQRSLSEIRFYQTYSFANAISNILNNRFNYLAMLEGFYSDKEYTATFALPFQRYSIFHQFIGFVVHTIINEEIYDIDLDSRQNIFHDFNDIPEALQDLQPSIFPINEALNYYEIAHTTFETWLHEKNKTFLEASDDDVYEYYLELQLEEAYDILLERTVSEVFFLLFQNRQLLLLFNDIISTQIEEITIEELEINDQRYFSSAGVLKRVHIPSWVKRAVFFRDRGFCTICLRDLSGILSIGNTENFDHIVPLAKGGLNDVSNLQLLCEKCNKEKLHHVAATSKYYESWYSMATEDIP